MLTSFFEWAVCGDEYFLSPFCLCCVLFLSDLKILNPVAVIRIELLLTFYACNGLTVK